MCFGGRQSAPPAPEPVAPAPPPVRGTEQVAPAPAGASTTEGTSYSEGSDINAKKKGKTQLKIPLIEQTGTGLQVGG